MCADLILLRFNIAAARDRRRLLCILVPACYIVAQRVAPYFSVRTVTAHLVFTNSKARPAPVVTAVFSSAVNGNCYTPAAAALDKYDIGKVIGDGNFAVVKECVDR